MRDRYGAPGCQRCGPGVNPRPHDSLRQESQRAGGAGGHGHLSAGCPLADLFIQPAAVGSVPPPLGHRGRLSVGGRKVRFWRWPAMSTQVAGQRVKAHRPGRRPEWWRCGEPLARFRGARS